MRIKTRIAPSPTGLFHVGNARTALFNYLFAKKHHGQFLLRIEDTDLTRSKKVYEDDIVTNLKWLGLEWDGEIARQSERREVHRSHLEVLISTQKAFYCFHSKEDLDQEQKSQALNRETLRHICGDFANQDRLGQESAVIRLKNPNKKVVFKDLIRGEVAFESDLLGDIALAKNINEPLYNFAAAVDDHEMRISHVIRGEDHLSNTPKQMLTQEALGFGQPEYAHVPLILAADRSKLSKRHGGTAVSEYRELGYLPQAMINFMALLGWHPQTDQEIFTVEELIKEFDISRVQKAGAVFDIAKLDSINHHYITKMMPAETAQRVEPFLAGYEISRERLIRLAHLFQDRLTKLSDIKEAAGFIFELPQYQPGLLVWKDASRQATKDNLETALMVLEKLLDQSFDIDTLTTEIMPLANKIGRGEMLWPLRAALSGLGKSPGPFEIMEVLGKEESLRRIKVAIDKLWIR